MEVDLIQCHGLFRQYCHALTTGQNIGEANAWMTSIIHNDLSTAIVEQVLTNDDDEIVLFYAANMLHSILRNGQTTSHSRVAALFDVSVYFSAFRHIDQVAAYRLCFKLLKAHQTGVEYCYLITHS